MSAQATRRMRIGRRQQGPREKLIREVAAAEQRHRTACRDYKKAVQRARRAGVPLREDVAPKATFEVTGHEIHFFIGGLDHPKHGHTVLRMTGSLSLACLAELAAKIENGRVTYDRSLEGRARVVESSPYR